MIELVTWRDANFAREDFDDDTEDFLVETVGWVSVVGIWLRIESEHQPDGQMRAVTRVPLENVVKRERMYGHDEVTEWQVPAV